MSFEKPIMGLDSEIAIDRKTNNISLVAEKSGIWTLYERLPHSSEMKPIIARNSSPFPESSESKMNKIYFMKPNRPLAQTSIQCEVPEPIPVFFHWRDKNDGGIHFLPNLNQEALSTESLQNLTDDVENIEESIPHTQRPDEQSGDGFEVYCLSRNPLSIHKLSYSRTLEQQKATKTSSQEFKLLNQSGSGPGNCRYLGMHTFGKQETPQLDILCFLFDDWGAGYYSSGNTGTSTTNFNLQKSASAGTLKFSDLYADQASDRVYILTKNIPSDKSQKMLTEVHQFTRSDTTFTKTFSLELDFPSDCQPSTHPTERFAAVCDDTNTKLWLVVFLLPTKTDAAQKTRLCSFFFERKNTEDDFNLKEKNSCLLAQGVGSVDVQLFACARAEGGKIKRDLDSQGRFVRGCLRGGAQRKGVGVKGAAESRWVTFFEISVQDLVVLEEEEESPEDF